MECTLSITTCSECKSEYNIFEPYDIIILPLKTCPYGISNSEADRLLNKDNNNKNKDIYKIPGKTNFYYIFFEFLFLYINIYTSSNLIFLKNLLFENKLNH
jgi:hypothetical protein